jgi:HSP20 family protein
MEIRNRNRFLGGFQNKDYMGDYLTGKDDRYTPAINIAENEKRYKIEMGLPGFNKDNFQIDIERDCLFVRGVSEKGKSHVKEEYTRQEFNVESFEKTFQLPRHIDQEKISAKFIDGMLEIELPKKDEPEKGSRKIRVL